MNAGFHKAVLVWSTLTVLVGVIVFAHFEWQGEKRQAHRDAAEAGARIADLVAAAPIRGADEQALRTFARGIFQHGGEAGLVYLAIELPEGQPIARFGELLGRVPPEIAQRMDADGGYPHRTFDIPGESAVFHDFIRSFAGPDGVAGLVRVGVQDRTQRFISRRSLSTLALVAFLLISVLTVGNYLIQRGLQNLSAFRGGAGGNGAAGDGGDIVAMATRLDRTLGELQSKLDDLTSSNNLLSSRLGVAAFEKDQALSVLDAMGLGILLLGVDDRVRYINRALLHLTGLKARDGSDRPVGEVIGQGDVVRMVEEVDPSYDGANHPVEIEFPETAPGRHFSVTSRLLLDAAGKPAGKILFVADVTRARLAETAQNDFIARVAHELMTPLTSIKACSEMLTTGDASSAEMQQEFYNTISSETDRLSSLVRNLLNISRMEVGSLTIERSLVRTDWLLDDCLPAVEAAARARNISLVRRLPDKFPSLMGDKELLKVVLVNIIGNAVKYTPPGGEVKVALSERDREVLIEVTDNGFGIDPEDLPHIFEKFYRGRGRSVRETTGSGLGLSTAHQIVLLHGGRIQVESQMGKGSHFTVRLPVEVHQLGHPG